MELQGNKKTGSRVGNGERNPAKPEARRAEGAGANESTLG